MQNKDLFSKVLVIGPDYKNHRGGIGALIATLSKYYVPFIFIPTFKAFNSNIIKTLFFFKQYLIILIKLSFDRKIRIIHMHGSQDGSFFRKYLVFLMAKYLFKKRIVFHSNASRFDVFYEKSSPFVKKRIKFFIENVDVVIGVSDTWRDFFKNSFDCKKVEKLYNCVEPIVLNPNEGNDNTKDFHLLFLGRIGERKGIFDLLEVIIENKELQNIPLSIGGDGEIDKLNGIITEFNLSPNVQYVGWIDGNKKDSILRKGGVFILPSYHEGLPLAILEAMNYGLPIISTKVGGIQEAVKDKVNGILIDAGDKNALKDALKYFIDYPSEVERMGKASKELIRTFYGDYIIYEIARIYEDLI